MYSERLIKKLKNDTALRNLADYIITYDISPMEKVKRSMFLLEFWVNNRRKFYKLQKRSNMQNEKTADNVNKFGFLLLQLKAICDGKKVKDEVIDGYDFEDRKRMFNIINGVKD